ncbi:MAG: hypothetical protein DLM52_07955 [Chthoniobacterales bacterium]|nr:MAG: hypothetical protein DLM52_07955 [Chthoniobacterales bacterium]
MAEEIVGNPAYRKVVADLRSCEERYGSLVDSITSDDSRLASAIAALKSEVEQRRRLELEPEADAEELGCAVGSQFRVANHRGWSNRRTSVRSCFAVGSQESGWEINSVSATIEARRI